MYNGGLFILLFRKTSDEQIPSLPGIQNIMFWICTDAFGEIELQS